MLTLGQKELIYSAWSYADDEDKSTEWAIQYASDLANVEYDDVVDFIASDEFSVGYQNYCENLEE